MKQRCPKELQRESLRVTTSRSGENCLAMAAISAVPGDKRSPFSVDQFRLLKFTVALAWQSEKRFGAQIPRVRGGPSARFHNGRSYEHSGLPHSNFYAEARGVAGCSERAFANSPPLLDVVVTPEAVSSDARTGLARVPDLQPLAAGDEAERPRPMKRPTRSWCRLYAQW
jgi:hypothetical protein